MIKVTLKGKTYDLSNKTQREIYWTEYAKSKLISKVISSVFSFDKESIDNMGWDKSPNFGLEFTDGSVIFPSSDDEGNDAGHFALRSDSPNKNIVGFYVSDVKYLTDTEKKDLGFYKNGLVIKLRNPNPNNILETCLIVAQCDAEGNDSGVVLGNSKDGEEWTFPTL